MSITLSDDLSKRLQQAADARGVTPEQLIDQFLADNHTAPAAITSSEHDDDLWTDEEIEEMMRPKPLTGQQMVEQGYIGGWEHKGITDSQEWLEQQRAKRRQRHSK